MTGRRDGESSKPESDQDEEDAEWRDAHAETLFVLLERLLVLPVALAFLVLEEVVLPVFVPRVFVGVGHAPGMPRSTRIQSSPSRGA